MYRLIPVHALIYRIAQNGDDYSIGVILFNAKNAPVRDHRDRKRIGRFCVYETLFVEIQPVDIFQPGPR